MDEDSGTYTCIASNGVGNNASVIIQLIVQGLEQLNHNYCIHYTIVAPKRFSYTTILFLI